MKKLFGTDGMRGEASEFPLDEHTIFNVGKSLARQFRENLGKTPKFITGRDTRESGEWIERAFHAGAHSENAVCESAEVITTPGVAFLAKHFDFDAGIVISASHNPFYDNGIKIFSPSGKKIDGETERQIEAYIFQNINNEILIEKSDFEKSKSGEYQTAYLEHFEKEFAGLNLENLKIVMDCANGAASFLAPKLFEKFGAEVVALNCEPNGKNINDNCGSLFVGNLQKKVTEENADFGVAFDGDADRSLFSDEKGNLVDGDSTLWIMAQHLTAHNKLSNQKIVATVMSNIGLEAALKTKNIELLRTSVGDKYVLAELLKTNSAVGGEQSGHIIFPEKSLVGDGIMTALLILEALSENKKSLSEMTDGFTRFPQTLVNVKVKNKLPFEEVEEINRASKELETELGEKGRLLLRYSGTENLARVMIEGEQQAEIEAQANRLAEIIGKSLG
jgi:phosphoglucosamine mutase